MLKPLSVSTEALRPKAPISPELAQRVFRAMHGYYGALFLSKWANGVVENGEDRGVADAMRVWAYELRSYDAKVVLDAISRCKTAHPEFPPSLPQFVGLCEAVKPRQVFRALPMSAELHAERSKAHREKLNALRASMQPKAGGLSLLFAAIADAVKCGGGDEVAALKRLESMVKA